MYDLNALYYFAQIVDHGGFGAASRATGVSKSRLSRSIQELENYLSARLINRSTRHFAVTDLGQEFYAHCLQVLTASEAARASVEKKQVVPQGTVRISCPTALLNFVVAGMISRFMTRFPLVKVQIESTNREVDVLREGLDLALHVKTPPFEDSGLVMKRLSRSPQELVASPQFLQQHGYPGSAQELSKLPSLHWGLQRRDYAWELQGPAQQSLQIPHTPRLVTDDIITIRRAALDHGGIAQLPLLVCFKDLHQALLVPALPDWKPPEAVVYALFPSRQGLLPSVRSLLDFLTDSFGEMDFSNLQASYAQSGDADACFMRD